MGSFKDLKGHLTMFAFVAILSLLGLFGKVWLSGFCSIVLRNNFLDDLLPGKIWKLVPRFERGESLLR